MDSERDPNKQTQPIAVEERVLTEVEHLSHGRLPNGEYMPGVEEAVFLNLKTAVQEAAMPYAVTTTTHEYLRTSDRKGVFLWMGRTAVQNALSGYKFHRAPEARERVGIEVDEARHAENDLRPGVMKVFISPRMSEQDADRETAKQEHLADDDAVRVSWIETDGQGNITQRKLQSLLVRDIPLEAWVAMLQDPNNVFGRAFEVEDPNSALSVMGLHRGLELPLNKLQDGPVGIVQAVLPYIEDPEIRRSVEYQLARFEGDQDKLDEQADMIARRWLQFEKDLEESLHTGWANKGIRRFIVGLQHHWSDDDLAFINGQAMGQDYLMSRELAILLENAKQNTLWTEAGVISGNEKVINQMDDAVVLQILDNHQQIYGNGFDPYQAQLLEMQNIRLIASQNVNVGGGCNGERAGNFNGNDNLSDDPRLHVLERENMQEEDSDVLKWTKGVCRIESCSSRPDMTDVGPCSVCKKCQHVYDIGGDPTYQIPPVFKVTEEILEILFAELDTYRNEAEMFDTFFADLDAYREERDLQPA